MAHDVRLGRNKYDHGEPPKINGCSSTSCLEKSCLSSLFWMVGVFREGWVSKRTDEKAEHCSWIVASEIEVLLGGTPLVMDPDHHIKKHKGLPYD